tara:strand:- start:1858 stop:2499 length:642 start_codon:yes stop_codon:yes gene_type:complete
MNIDLEFFILCFSSLFALVNPIGIVPIFISITEECTSKEKNKIILNSIGFAFFVLISFSLIGDLIFSFYGITIHAFKIAGGIILFKISLDMVESKRSRTKTTPAEEKEAEDKKEVAYTPLGIPLIAGPGSIASIMILYSETNGDINYKIHLFLALACVLLITLLIFRISKYLTKTFGKSGLRIMQRIMGLILMVISIEFIFKGVESIVTKWTF